MTGPKRILARFHGNGSDRGASILESAALIGIAAVIVVGLSMSSIGDTLHDATRKYVCRVEGPDCGEETWVERERPEKPEEYTWTLASAWDGEVRGEGSAKVAIEFALAQRGKPYQWGARGRQSYDCSSLMMESWREAGVSIPRTTWTQINSLQRIPKSDLKPGDLIFFHTMEGYPPPTHVGMYIGGGQMVHAGDPVQVVQVIGNSHWESIWYGQARVPQG
ncbi:C40 family peptidase [Streptomonospora litoralis]|uniref:Putative endopeptidase p60 n=1 Tax=Streptomonospora litoralis TaxID=2498135 RepID=A0A4P6PYG1_9ACTN|nr:C40 family peptidase [Streptomonospora litoralis]QBI53163.1 putative endopeptidase p60 precursor [Streptomonospora litoralis]